jgi:hypothetical protein
VICTGDGLAQRVDSGAEYFDGVLDTSTEVGHVDAGLRMVKLLSLFKNALSNYRTRCRPVTTKLICLFSCIDQKPGTNILHPVGKKVYVTGYCNPIFRYDRLRVHGELIEICFLIGVNDYVTATRSQCRSYSLS